MQAVCDSWNLTYFLGARKRTNFTEEIFYFVWCWYCLNSESRCETRWLFTNPQNLLFVKKSNFRENPLPGRFMKAVLYPLKSPCLYPINPGGVTFLQGSNTNTTGGWKQQQPKKRGEEKKSWGQWSRAARCPAASGEAQRNNKEPQPPFEPVTQNNPVSGAADSVLFFLSQLEISNRHGY